MLCNYYTKYTEFLHNISLHYTAYPIILYYIWFHVNINMVICSYFFVYMLYNFFSFFVCRFHILSCLSTFILSRKHFCHTTRVHTSTGVTAPVTVTESTVLSNASTYTCTLGMHNVLATGVFSPLLFFNLSNERLEIVTRLLNYRQLGVCF